MQIAHTTTPVRAALDHLDQLYSDDCKALLPMAAEAIESVSKVLRDSKPLHPDVLARLLDSVARTVRAAHMSIEAVVVELEEGSLNTTTS